VWARSSAISQAGYPVKIGPKALKFFEDYFDEKYPLPKQDMVAIPDFSAGAMENWGLITYRYFKWCCYKYGYPTSASPKPRSNCP